MNLLKVEMRRAVHRRAVWVLILVALAGVRVRRRHRVHELEWQDDRRAPFPQ